MNKKKGSAILIVIIVSVTISVYINSLIVTKNNYTIVSKKYTNIIEDYYSKDISNLSDIYKELEKINK